ncbi:SPFH domain-containing protein [Pedobacter metabolipauper]|uniref:Membrane protease subunit (Stomatin/prohibitin family) n=1 Tax=Pedobacter metabolipauper TaxID=425513 RepID=A0A4R6SQR6_9SPHI|nr:SPFH domain-containing protein [Pedobacter metabolipauper]TDQ07101.1 membrane protease subunit (stomatin/prohibitin family) [Pedobacter metabolipauper]
MGLGDFFRKQLRTVIEWKDQQPDLLLYKFPVPTSEIKDNSQLLISPGQGCILVYEGQIKDVLNEEGLYTLNTDNLPFITNLMKYMQLFESEHKTHLYFYRKADSVNQPWGTPSPVKYLDSEYKIPVELGIYGNYSMRISDPLLLFKEIIGSKDIYSTADAKDLLLSRLPQTLISHLAQAKLSYIDIDAQLMVLAEALKEKLNSEFTKVGLELKDFKIQGTSFDVSTQERMNRIADITADSRAASEGGLTYLEIEKLKALRDAARNEGGLAGAGLQLGFGMEMGKVLEDKKEEVTAYDPKADPVVQLQKLKLLLDEEILTREEFDAKKKEILSKM